MYKCICGKEYENKNAIKGHKAKCKLYQKELRHLINKHFNKQFLEWWFYKKQGAAYTLTKMFNSKYNELGFNLNTEKIIHICHELGIKTWSIKEGNNLPHIHKHRHEHNNLARGTVGYIKRQKKLEEEGITNVFQRESVKQKIKQTMFEKYGVTSVAYLDWFKSNNGQESKPHIKVLKYLESRGLEKNIDIFSEQNHLFEHYNSTIKKNFCPRPDIWIPSINTVIEIYGDRWHANPKIYNKNDIIHTWYGDMTAEKIWEKDKIRISHMKKYFGVKVLILWENDINKDNYINFLDKKIDGIYKN